MPLSDIAVNPCTVSELVRLCMRKRDSDSDSVSDNSNLEELEEDEVVSDATQINKQIGCINK